LARAYRPGVFVFWRGTRAMEVLTMLSNDEFLRAFFSAELANSSFHHRDHLRPMVTPRATTTP
jgi:hypothetical protein